MGSLRVSNFNKMSRNMEKLDEEFNNFMHKVTEVSNIVHKLASTDKKAQEIGDLEAAQYLGETPNSKEIENVDEETIKIQIKSDRTVLNKKALLMGDNKDPSTMSQEAFMAEVSRDADQRHQDKLVRKEKMETFKKQATKAFRRGEYEKALSLYNKAIDQIKDSCLLYNNRALTYINLKLYDKAVTDLVDWALRLNEDCLKSWLLLAKAHFLNKDREAFEMAISEAKDRNPGHIPFIDEFVTDLTENAP